METIPALTETIGPHLEEIPYIALETLGNVFKEGAEGKYGVDNWKRAVGDWKWQKERTRHAIAHLYKWANGDRSEPHLAKVAWFCFIMIWIEAEQVKRGIVSRMYGRPEEPQENFPSV